MRIRVSILIAVLFSAMAIHAAVITVPIGLAPGSTYRLAFVTSTGTDATSSNIADYNSFVQSVGATLGLPGVTWVALASTDGMSAAGNIGTFTDPVYNLAGDLVTNGSAGLFGTTITNLNTCICIDETGGDGSGSLVWTGSNPDGSTDFPLGSSGPTYGNAGNTDSTYIQLGSREIFNTQTKPLYAISSQLIVPGSQVPEPGSMLLLGTGAVALLLRKLRRA